MSLTPNKLKPLALALIVLMAWFNNGLAQLAIEEENLVAALSLNILRFSTWPESATNAFNLCVYGDNVTKEAFSSLEAKTIGTRSLHVTPLAHLIELDKCNALYINDVKANILSQLFNEIRKKPILTIGSTEAFADNGGMIGLRKINGKLAIDINLRVINESAIVVSSRLLSLAKIVDQ